jgi:hypothetical protein
MLAKETMFAPDHYYTVILSEILRGYPVGSNHRLNLHADNTKPHPSKQTKEVMKESKPRGVLHPLFSPDRTPSDCFLFGFVNEKLQGTEFMEKDNLFANLPEILNGISGKLLKVILTEWGKWLQTCVDGCGEYVE